MSYQQVRVPDNAAPIDLAKDGSLQVPPRPIIPCIEGDGIGCDITPVMRRVVDAAVQKAYGERRAIAWMDAYLGEGAAQRYDGEYFPDETLKVLKEYRVAIKGPLTTPVGGGMRSLNVALRQRLDLYACVRPVRWFPGVPTPVHSPEKTNMVIFRENSEDIYAGIEWPAGSPEAERLIHFLQKDLGVGSIRFPDNCGIGIKPVSQQGTARLVRRALQYAIDEGLPSVTLVHKGNIMKFTEGAFKQWGYEVAQKEFGGRLLDGGPWCVVPNPRNGKEIVVKDVIADAMLQQILLRPEEYSLIATLNLNGDYLSDALAAQVGGIGMAPGANLGEEVAVFEATHGTAPKYAGQDKVNPGSLILSAEMMLRHLGWEEAADHILQGLSSATAAHTVTYDLHRLLKPAEMKKAKLLSCSGFGEAIIRGMA